MAPSGKLIFLVRCGLCGFFTVVMSEYTRGRMGLPGASLFGDELSDTVLLRWVLRLSITKNTNTLLLLWLEYLITLHLQVFGKLYVQLKLNIDLLEISKKLRT